MATDDERRRVAERLRYAAEQDQPYTHPTLACFIGADCADVWTRLADLIEPNPVESDGFDREALLALAGILRTPEQDADCGACPLRKWCDTELYNGHRITCFECRTWHAADAILEACGERAS